MDADCKKTVEQTTNESPPASRVMSKSRIIKNLTVLCVLYLFIYTAFLGLITLQSTLNSEANVGVISQSIIFATMAMTSLFLPRLISIKFGLKTAIVIAAFSYAPYTAGSFFPIPWTLYPSAVLQGMGSAILWVSVSSYINELSFLYADEDIEKASHVTTKFFAIFCMAYMTPDVWGNAVDYYVLQQPQSVNSTQDIPRLSPFYNSSTKNVVCGADFCGGIEQELQLPSQETRNVLVGTYVVIVIIAGLITAIFLDSLTINYTSMKTAEGTFSQVMSAIKRMIKPDQLLLVISTIYTGLQAGFLYGDYSEAFVACAWGIEYIGLVFLCTGAACVIVCGLQSRFENYLPRTLLMTISTICNIVVFICMLHWKPSNGHPALMYIILGFCSVSNITLELQLSAFYGVLFREETEAAFAVFRFFEAIGYMIAFSCNSVMCMSSKIYMQLAFTSFGFSGYITVIFRKRLISKNCDVTSSPKH